MDATGIVITVLVFAAATVVLYFVIKLAVKNAVLDALYGTGETPTTAHVGLRSAISGGLADDRAATAATEAAGDPL
ncbi:MAG: hypothetical protein EPO52_17670 [Herbiconiux sp.]|uniref:hypothetical protein n=1 Tax=Herbiconiux sp. TaxID=1871186 RepID=UPI001225568C|nr:hypothetical protein [Herbiconiux sp.]TAJ46362.1 MAG: hypothetical protein EPO52_17670 [Herbiconiux sp.]